METTQKEFVTHEELDVWGGEIMRQMDEIRDHILTRVATKEDLEIIRREMATKEELERVFLILDEIRENTKK